EVVYEGKRLRRVGTELEPVYVDEEGVTYPLRCCRRRSSLRPKRRSRGRDRGGLRSQGLRGVKRESS
ncbi:MAG: hypothetical protein QXT79_09975, partial [Thermofilaceae archaeon]